MRKLLNVIKHGNFLESVGHFFAKKFLSDHYRVIWDMNYLHENETISKSGNDYVRYASLELLAKEVGLKDIPGSVAELGVYKGDFARLINKNFPDRLLYLFDTFEGFEESDVAVDVLFGHSSGKQDFSNTSESLVMSKMLYPEKICIRKGWFPTTTEGLETERFVFVSIDADLYEPIYAGLKFFYPKIQNGGGNFCTRLQ